MTKITPFKAVRPTRDKAHLVASRPFHTYKKSILNAKLKDNPFTFLHIINPEFGKKNSTEPNSKERFLKVKHKYQEFCEDGILFQDQQASFYVYRQTKNGHTFTGVIGGASIDDYKNNVIKKHEETLTEREQMFAEYLDTAGFNAEPVLIIHPEHKKLAECINEITNQRSEYEFTTTDKITHELWVVNDPITIQHIVTYFEEMDNVYIADGHHRSSSSFIYGSQKRDKSLKYKGCESFNHVLSFFIPENEVKILEFNRLVKDLNGLSHEQFVEGIQEKFDLEKIKSPRLPQKAHEFIVYIDQTWYSLKCKPGSFNNNDDVASIDAEILTKNLLDPILGISDLKTDKRISFLNGESGTKGIKKVIDKGAARVGFILHPVSVEELINIADQDGIMPPKSTWIEPKLRSGLTIFALDD